MKTGIFLTLVSLLGLSAAQPHRHGHFHNQRRALITEVEVVTVTAPLVYVEVFGSDTFTFTEGFPQIPAPTPTEVPASYTPPPPPPPTSTTPSSTSLPPVVIPTPAPTSSTSSPAPPPPPPTTLSSITQAPPPPPPAPTSSAPYSSAPAPSAAAPSFAPAPSSTGNGYGVSYNPYHDNGDCKNDHAVRKDIEHLKEYAMLRIYGTDCYQLDTVIPAVKSHDGMRLFLGISDVNSAASEAQLIVDAVKKYFDGDWSRIDTVSVGNEVVHSGAASVGQVIAGMRAARGVLESGGFTGPVVTVDTIETFLNPDGSGIQLCKESSYNAANCHAFYDNSGYYNKGSEAGDFVTMQVGRFKQGCGDRRTVITESGWPHSSSFPLSSFGNGPIPDEANHIAAISSLKEAFSGNRSDLVLFSAFDDMWKKDFSDTKGTEKFWGIHGTQ